MPSHPQLLVLLALGLPIVLAWVLCPKCVAILELGSPARALRVIALSAQSLLLLGVLILLLLFSR